MKIILFSPQCPPRLQFIANFISIEISNSSCVITGNTNEYINEDAIKINYSSAPLAGNEIWIPPRELLFQNEIHPQPIECFFWDDLKIFYKTDGDIPFDIFAASFYLLSRYEEYLPFEPDRYGRFPHTASLAFRENFLQQPLINLWIEKLIVHIKQKFSAYTYPAKKFQFTPTYDIDIAYAYRHQPFIHMAGGLVKSIGKPRTFFERTNVLLGKNKDPFDIYDWLHDLHQAYQLDPVYFFLIADKKGRYDKNITPKKIAMQHLIHQHEQKYHIGIHPSWRSNGNEYMLQKEIERLSKITGRPVLHSRQHYLCMDMPHTYRKLVHQGIEHDYSMGYGASNGFRASVAGSFYWYDLLLEKQENLCIHPFCFMDTTCFYNQNYTTGMAEEELQQYCTIVKSVNGCLDTVFHNHFLAEQKRWLPWRKMYADFISRNF